MSTCQLCDIDSKETWNTPLMESRNFRVLPSLGALVEGWVLLVPKTHFLSMGTLPTSLVPEMENFKGAVARRLRRIYGAVSVFEHGPGDDQRKVGCGVDHAHLHMVPIDFDLLTAVTPFLPSDSRLEDASFADCQLAAHAGDDYLYLEQPLGKGQIVRHQGLGSQLFRRAIAARLGAPSEFNWRTHPQIENVDATIRAFADEGRSGTPLLDVHEYAV
jgi:ATP adenylyltransferase